MKKTTASFIYCTSRKKIVFSYKFKLHKVYWGKYVHMIITRYRDLAMVWRHHDVQYIFKDLTQIFLFDPDFSQRVSPNYSETNTNIDNNHIENFMRCGSSIFSRIGRVVTPVYWHAGWSPTGSKNMFFCVKSLCDLILSEHLPERLYAWLTIEVISNNTVVRNYRFLFVNYYYMVYCYSRISMPNGQTFRR